MSNRQVKNWKGYTLTGIGVVFLLVGLVIATINSPDCRGNVICHLTYVPVTLPAIYCVLGSTVPFYLASRSMNGRASKTGMIGLSISSMLIIGTIGVLLSIIALGFMIKVVASAFAG